MTKSGSAFSVCAMPFSWVMQRIGTRSAYLAREAPTLLRFVGACALGTVRGKGIDFEQLTEDYLLGTRMKPAERSYFRGALERRSLSAWALPVSFLRIPPRLERRWLGENALKSLHLARKRLVAEHLPPAKRILDLGGAVDIHPEGALLAMGYPHRPTEVDIVDLPDDQRFHKKGEASLRDLNLSDGTKVRYVYAPMWDLSQFPEGSFDLVWSGQSIEHITESQADATLEEAFRCLKPGGQLCLDTPNRAVTALLDKNYSHPEHKIEYYPDELAEKVRAAGFRVEQLKAVTPLPISARLGKLSKLEIFQEARVSEEYETGFSFFLRAVKP